MTDRDLGEPVAAGRRDSHGADRQALAETLFVTAAFALVVLGAIVELRNDARLVQREPAEFARY
jgi:hypothetical protein